MAVNCKDYLMDNILIIYTSHLLLLKSYITLQRNYRQKLIIQFSFTCMKPMIVLILDSQFWSFVVCSSIKAIVNIFFSPNGVLQVQKKRGDLRLIVASATLDAEVKLLGFVHVVFLKCLISGRKYDSHASLGISPAESRVA